MNENKQEKKHDKTAGNTKRKKHILLALQILIIATIVANTFAVIFPDICITAFLVTLAFFAIIAYIIRTKISQIYPQDKHAYYVFFAGIAFLAVLMPQIPKLLVNGTVNLRFVYYNFLWSTFLLIGAIVLFYIGFFVFFGRNYTYAKVVLADNEKAAVETTFDLLARSQEGSFVVENSAKAKKGDKIKVRVRGSLFGTRKPTETIEVTSE